MISDWIPIITYIGAAISLITIGIKIGKTLQTFDQVVQDNKEIRKEIEAIKTMLTVLNNQQINRLEEEKKQLEAHTNQLRTKLTELETGNKLKDGTLKT